MDVEFDESKNLITISGMNEDDVNYMRDMISDIRRNLDLQMQAMTKVAFNFIEFQLHEMRVIVCRSPVRCQKESVKQCLTKALSKIFSQTLASPSR